MFNASLITGYCLAGVMLMNHYKLGILVILLVLPKEAWVSRIHYKETSLAEMLQRARIIAVVKKTTQGRKVKAMPIRKLLKSYPPYKYPVSVFEIVKGLRGDEMTAGRVIEVYPADFDKRLDLYRRYVIDGVSKSPIYASYKPKAYKPDDELLILFLTTTDDGYLSYFCLDSMEGMEYESRILAVENKI